MFASQLKENKWKKQKSNQLPIAPFNETDNDGFLDVHGARVQLRNFKKIIRLIQDWHTITYHETYLVYFISWYCVCFSLHFFVQFKSFRWTKFWRPKSTFRILCVQFSDDIFFRACVFHFGEQSRQKFSICWNRMWHQKLFLFFRPQITHLLLECRLRSLIVAKFLQHSGHLNSEFATFFGFMCSFVFVFRSDSTFWSLSIIDSGLRPFGFCCVDIDPLQKRLMCRIRCDLSKNSREHFVHMNTMLRVCTQFMWRSRLRLSEKLFEHVGTEHSNDFMPACTESMCRFILHSRPNRFKHVLNGHWKRFKPMWIVSMCIWILTLAPYDFPHKSHWNVFLDTLWLFRHVILSTMRFLLFGE